MGIGILRDKQQIGGLKVFEFVGQGVIKKMEEIIFVYLLCMDNIMVRNASNRTCAVHEAHWMHLQRTKFSSLFAKFWVVDRVGNKGEGGNGSKMIFE